MAARWDRLTGVVLLAFAGYTIVAGRQMDYWQGRIPGPGFAPIYIGAGLALAALILLLRPAPPRPGHEHAAAQVERAEAWRDVVLALQIAAIAVAATLLIPWLGMMAGVGLLLLGLVKLLGGSWRSAVSTAVLLPTVFHLVFVRWLQVPVPKGPWGF